MVVSHCKIYIQFLRVCDVHVLRSGVQNKIKFRQQKQVAKLAGQLSPDENFWLYGIYYSEPYTYTLHTIYMYMYMSDIIGHCISVDIS